MNFRHIAAAGASVLALLLTACGGGGGGGIGGSGSAAGTLSVKLTDAPACGYDEVNVTIERIRVHQSASAADGDSGWSEIVLNPARRVDLLTLSNGVIEELGETPLPSGRYTQLRLVLAANSAGNPLANSVLPSGGTETALDTPSAQQSGLKMNVNIDVPANRRIDVLLDFDACKSVVKRGNSGRYNLKPVVSVTPLLSDAGLRIVGWVDPSIALGSTLVSAQAGGVPVKATVPDASGRFVLYPVPVGSYSLVVQADGRVTAVMTGVPVTDTAFTVVNSASLPIDPAPAASAPRIVAGTVSAVPAEVRALQTLSGGPRIEVAWMPVDTDSGVGPGSFEFALSIDAPQRLAYVANPVSLPFAADVGAAGFYTLEATSGGVLRTLDIDALVAVPPVQFIFP